MLKTLPTLLIAVLVAQSRPAKRSPTARIAADGSSALPRHVKKVISAAACNLLNGFSDNGPGAVESFGVTAMGAADYAANANAPTAAIPQLILFCDARLPADAIGVEAVELEYFAPNEVGNTAPSLYAYLDVRAPDGTGYFYSQTLNAGSCTGGLTELYSGTNPLTTCEIHTYQSLEPDAGALSSTAPSWMYPSMHYLVFLPPSPDSRLPNAVYRIVIHYLAQ